MAAKKRKEELVTQRSIEVLKDCCRPNGAIIAVNAEHDVCPKDVQSYHYVWPRDAGYICLALSSIGEYKTQLKFFDWLLHRAEGLDKGLIFQNYYPNGRKRWTNFQPDQSGIILIAIAALLKKGYKNKSTIKLATKLSDKIADLWDKDHFKYVSQDLWEERFCYPELEQCFPYSSAVVAKGLEDAGALIGKDFSKKVKEMKRLARSAYDKKSKLILNRTGTNQDNRTDASSLGLIWPGKINIASDFIYMVESRLKKPLGILRYEHDDYDGFRHDASDARRGAGAWPLLGFWLSIGFKLCGNSKKARKYYDLALASADEKGYLPEQVFNNNTQSSVKPLAWAHAMQIIAKNILEGKGSM